MDAAIEIERFASFDHPTRRFIAYAIGHVPELAAFVGDQATHAGNKPAPFKITDQERAERDDAYAAIPLLRGCQGKGAKGQGERRKQFGALLGMAKVDLKWKRLTDLPQFIFCYERLVGAQWRQLLLP